jgi:hypothetical protein
MTGDVRIIVGGQFLLRNVPWESISDTEGGQDSGQTISEVANNN